MDTIFVYLPLLLSIAGVTTLVALSIIDFRTWLLPDWLNATLALLGLAFHFSVGFIFFTPAELMYGAMMGSGILYLVRFFGNRYYKQDTLGLGDVKLLAAGGLWLGMEGVIMAMTIGAFAGLIHGVTVAVVRAIRDKTRPNLHRLMIPAGPGFCIGILATGLWQYLGFFMG